MNTKLLGRVTLALGAVLLVSLFAWEACSEELSIVQVHRSIPLSDEEPVYKDVYINGGSNSGLKNNLVISAYRKVIVKDATGSQPIGEIMIPVGQLKVIFVGPKVAIAREYKNAQLESTPTLDQPGFQLGDTIELKGSFVDNKKPQTTVASASTTPATVTPAANTEVAAAQSSANTSTTAIPAATTAAKLPTEQSAANTEAIKTVSETQREPSASEVH